MSKLLTRQSHDIGLYDSATSRTIKTAKVVDISKDCRCKGSSVLVYGKSKRGLICQIVRGCARIHFFVGELAGEMNVSPGNDTFGSWATEMGITKHTLRELMESNKP